MLAFVYVSINLATSVIGMNLQQLNQSGQNVRSFVVTSILALIITGLMWFCLEQFNSVVDCKRKSRERFGIDPSPKRSITLRVARVLGFISEFEYRFGH